ncbi:uncharacterized protein LOC117334659 [Pecten maximus]|uniref:uncharacterized protein LOC117334659 n=1 Tax=Pecten maximus TaxID=6579 RepID=UPI0014587E2F|nr:uncharacterized protein LOC117334659 [Pecten maximus]XP_033750302.1 uncharacterized protein LOC117334659 [Pecten maximus]
MTAVAGYNTVMDSAKSTTTLSAQDFMKQLHAIRHVLEKVEETNGKVFEQIKLRAKEKTVFEDTPQLIADMKAKAIALGEAMDARQISLTELEKSVTAVCSKVDGVVNIIDKAKQTGDQREEGLGLMKSELDGSVDNRQSRGGSVQSSSCKVKQLTCTVDQIHVPQKTQNGQKLKNRNTKEESPESLDDLPPIVGTSGFKRRLTLEGSDNRHKQEKLKQQRQQPNIGLSKSDLDPAYVNIKNMSVRIKEQEARFETEFKNMPGLSQDSTDGHGVSLLTDLIWQQWHSYAEEEKNKDSHRHIVRKKGPDVVLCLDVSQSMEGAPFEEMMTFAMKYVEGVERVASTNDLIENISVTTFGYITKVWLHMTSDYSAVKATLRDIHSLVPRGRSPIAGGLLVALAGCLGNCDGITVGRVPVLARIILISDGMGTPDHIKTGPELMRRQDEDIPSSLRVEGNLQHVSKNLKKRRNIVYCVPVGNANKRPLEEISKITGGQVFEPMRRDRLVQWSKLTVLAANLCQQCIEMVPGKSPEEIETILRLFYLSSESGEDKEDILSIASQLIRKIDDGSDEHMTSEHDADLPALGTRVRRGPDWHYPDHQDDNGPGTVCSHGKSGMVWVEWDNSHRNCYNYKDGAGEVVPVTERRVLKRGEIIATGCYVKRGDNWSSGEEDGGQGAMGVVTRVHQHGTVIVRWPNQIYKEYKFGSDGLFEVQVCSDEPRSTNSQEEGPSNSYSAPEGEGLRIESFLPPP